MVEVHDLAHASVLFDTDHHGIAAIPDVRHAVVAWLAERDVPAPTADTVVLLADELLTNAVRYTFGRVRFAIGEVDDAVMVQVFDESPELPNPLLTKPGDLGGHGLSIVVAVADRWGADHLTLDGRDGKVVWAAVHRPG